MSEHRQSIRQHMCWLRRLCAAHRMAYRSSVKIRISTNNPESLEKYELSRLSKHENHRAQQYRQMVSGSGEMAAIT